MRWIVCVLLALATPALALPDRPVTIVVGFAPGGATDTVARVLAERLAPRLGQPVIVQNVPGAGGTLGADRVAKAPPDGHMLAFVPSAHAVVPGLFARLPFDSVRDFAPVEWSSNACPIAPGRAGCDGRPHADDVRQCDRGCRTGA